MVSTEANFLCSMIVTQSHSTVTLSQVLYNKYILYFFQELNILSIYTAVLLYQEHCPCIIYMSAHFLVLLLSYCSTDCRYCGTPWDQYQLCSTDFCYQLVLSCTSCRQKGLTACCPVCQAKMQTPSGSPSCGHVQKEECECTHSRPRIPKDTL